MTEGRKLPAYFREYEDGKHRRYILLFAVNGGAFAIANLFSLDKTQDEPRRGCQGGGRHE
jgi:hypothetical protein